MNVIFRDFTDYTRDSIASKVLPIWKFLNSILPLYLWTCVYGIPLEKLDNNLNVTEDPAVILSNIAGSEVDRILDIIICRMNDLQIMKFLCFFVVVIIESSNIVKRRGQL